MAGQLAHNAAAMREVAVLCQIFGAVPGWMQKMNLDVAARWQKLIEVRIYEYYSSFQ